MAENAGTPTLGWSLQNLVTVTLMVLITFAVAGFAYRAFRAVTAQKAPPSPEGEIGPGS